MPNELKEAHRSWKTMNPGYDIRYFDLHMARKYLKNHFHQVFLRTFDCLEAFAYKSDFFRFALLYREGGWHSDWKQQCLKKNLLDNIANGTNFYSARDNGNHISVREQCVQNAFVGTPPQHPIIEKVLERQLVYVQSNFYSTGSSLFYNVCLFGKMIKSYEKEQQQEEGTTGDSAKTRIFPGVVGTFQSSLFNWNNEAVVRHKCENCGDGQDWDEGNNYNELWQARNAYCEDSKSIFHVIE